MDPLQPTGNQTDETNQPEASPPFSQNPQPDPAPAVFPPAAPDSGLVQPVEPSAPEEPAVPPVAIDAAPAVPVTVDPPTPEPPAPTLSSDPSPSPFTPTSEQPAPEATPADGGAVSAAAAAAATAYPDSAQKNPAPVETAAKPTGNKKKKIVTLAAGLAAAVLLLGGGFFAFTKFSGGLKLEKISEDKFSILVPKGYVRSAEESGLKFEEPDGDSETKSFVVAMAENYPRTPSAEEKKQLIEVFEQQVPALMKSFANDGNEKVEDVTTEKVTHNGKDAVRIKAKLSKDDKRAEVNMLVVIGDKGMYIAGTAIHAEDGDLAKESDKIINSLEFSE